LIQLEGATVSYFKSGQLKIKGNFKNDMQDGVWVFYNEDGTLDKKRSGTWKNNKKISD